MVGARADGADHLVWFGGGEDEHHMLRRLLHDFQQRVEALRRDHVSFVENENLVAVAGGGESGTFAQFAGVVHTVVRSGVDFHHVDGTRKPPVARSLQLSHSPHGCEVGPFAQLTQRARMRAELVLPQPRGPENR